MRRPCWPGAAVGQAERRPLVWRRGSAGGALGSREGIKGRSPPPPHKPPPPPSLGFLKRRRVRDASLPYKSRLVKHFIRQPSVYPPSLVSKITLRRYRAPGALRSTEGRRAARQRRRSRGCARRPHQHLRKHQRRPHRFRQLFFAPTPASLAR